MSRVLVVSLIAVTASLFTGVVIAHAATPGDCLDQAAAYCQHSTYTS